MAAVALSGWRTGYRWILLLLVALAGLVINAQSVFAADLSCIGAERKPGANGVDVLGLTLKFEPAVQMTGALDASIALVFVIDVDADRGERHLHAVLSHDSLLERYELEFAGRTRHFRLRAELLDAFANTLTFDDAASIKRIRVRLVLGKLPAPLRLPALLDPDWHLDTGWCVMQYNSGAPAL